MATAASDTGTAASSSRVLAPAARRERPGQDHADRAHGGDDDGHAQPGEESGAAAEEDPGPGGRHRDRDRHRGPREPGVTDPPQAMAADADQRADRGRQRDRVVRVRRPGHEAEDQPGHQQPAAEHDRGGAGPVGPGRPARHPQHGRERDQGGRDQPADLPAPLGGEQAGDAGPAAKRATATPAAGEAAAAGECAQPVSGARAGVSPSPGASTHPGARSRAAGRTSAPSTCASPRARARNLGLRPGRHRQTRRPGCP